MTRALSRLLVAGAALGALSACNLAPAYHVPTAPIAAGYKADPGWVESRPAAADSAAAKGAWWQLFGDAQLNALAERVAVSNQNVAAYRAAYAQANALLRQNRAALLPSVGLTGTSQQAGSMNRAAANGTQSLSAAASWEVDLWGRLGNTVSQAHAQAQASAADLANATLSAQGTLVSTYLQLRELDAQSAMLATTIADYRRSLAIARNQFAAGTVSSADVDTAQTNLSNAEATARDLVRQRTAAEDAIAVLVGENPSNFHIAPADWQPQVPDVPAALPAEILQRRPDIAAAERAVAAANANIGIQRAAFFPSLTLSADTGSQAARFADLFSAATSVWSLGATSALTLLDFGARNAKVAGARAAYDQAVAQYRQTVLTAFQQVEDTLAATQAYAAENAHYRIADAAATRAAKVALNSYQAGTADYTTVTTAQASAYGAHVNWLQSTLARQTAAVNLIVAIGGHWQAAPAPR